jgi:hypothetical protein
MRKVWMLVLMLTATTTAAADDGTANEAVPLPRNVISLDVINPTWSRFAVSGARVLSERVSVQLALGLLFVATGTTDERESEQRSWSVHSRSLGFELAPGARFFLLGKAPVGLWVGPELGVGIERNAFSVSGSMTGPAPTRHFSWIRGTALAGYSAALGKHVILQGAIGVGMRSTRMEDTFASNTQPPATERAVQRTWEVRPTTQLSLGYAF